MDRYNEFLAVIQSHKSFRANLGLNKRIVNDLGIDGDDADELIEELNKGFQSPQPPINWFRYFHTEGELLSWGYYPKLLMYRLGISKDLPLRYVEPLTVKELMGMYGVQVQDS